MPGSTTDPCLATDSDLKEAEAVAAAQSNRASRAANVIQCPGASLLVCAFNALHKEDVSFFLAS